MATTNKKNISSPDITRIFGKERVEILKLESLNLARTTLEPGWKWSKHVKPILGGESCQVIYPSYVLTGKIHVQMDNGREFDYVTGDAFELDAGYDAWTLGNEPVVILSFSSHRDTRMTAGKRELKAKTGRKEMGKMEKKHEYSS